MDFLVGSNLADSRVEAVDLGRQLQRELSLFVHVTNDHLFKDEYLFYRFDSKNKHRKFQDVVSNLSPAELIHVAKGLEGGIKLGDNRTSKDSLIVYPNTFFGSEAVDFLMKGRFASYSSLTQKVESQSSNYRFYLYPFFVLHFVMIAFGAFVKSRQEAVHLIRFIATELNLFQHVSADF